MPEVFFTCPHCGKEFPWSRRYNEVYPAVCEECGKKIYESDEQED